MERATDSRPHGSPDQDPRGAADTKGISLLRPARLRIARLVLVAALWVCVLGRLPAQTPPPAPPPPERVIRAGTIPDAFPYVFYDSDGNVHGFAAELLRASAHAVDLEVEFSPYPAPDLVRLLQTGEIDVALPLAHTEERKRQFNLCVPYLRLSASVFVRRGTPPIRSLADLATRRVAVHPGSAGEEYLRTHGLRDRIVPVRSVEDSVRAVDVGEADALVASRLTVLSIIERDKVRNIDPASFSLSGSRMAYSFALRKGDDELTSELNEGLAVIMRNGEYEQIYNRWYSTFEDRRLTREQVVTWVAVLLGVFLLLAFGAYLHQRRLRRLVAVQAKELTRQAGWLENVIQRAGCLLWTAQIVRRPAGPGHDWSFQDIRGHIADELLDTAALRRSHQLWTLESTPELAAMTARSEAALAEGHPGYAHEFRVVRGSRTYWLAERVSLQRLASGTWEAIGVIVDITRLKEAEAEIRRLNDDLEQRVRRRTEELEAAVHELESFSYSVSHDLRAPLRNIAGFATLARKHLPPAAHADLARFLGIVDSEAARLSGLIDELLAFSRLNRRELRRDPVPLDRIVREVVATDLAPAIGSRSIAWRIGPLPTVTGDATLLRQVLVNLLSNAVKYTARRPDAVIELGPEPAPAGLAGFYVRDNGAGFDPKYTDKLFGVFQRLHSAKEFDGVGIGLASVQRIVHRHGGTVRGEGRPNEGATFHVALPAD